MVLLVKLAVISKSGEEASFQLVFLHLLYTLAEKQPYLCKKHFMSNSNGVYKITWDKMVDSYEALRDCYIG